MSQVTILSSVGASSIIGLTVVNTSEPEHSKPTSKINALAVPSFLIIALIVASVPSSRVPLLTHTSSTT